MHEDVARCAGTGSSAVRIDAGDCVLDGRLHHAVADLPFNGSLDAIAGVAARAGAFLSKGLTPYYE
jgi:hypothetical protein